MNSNGTTAARARHNQERTDAYKQRNERSLRIKQIGNGFMVAEIDAAPMAYPELGTELSHGDGDVPMNVAEHVFRFFNKPLEMDL